MTAKVYVIETLVDGEWEPANFYECFPTEKEAEERRLRCYPDTHATKCFYRVKAYVRAAS